MADEINKEIPTIPPPAEAAAAPPKVDAVPPPAAKADDKNVLDTPAAQDADVKKEDAKPPEKYELKLSDGSLLTQANVDEIVSFAKERGLSNEAAQQLLERENGVVSQFQETQKQKFEELRGAWFKEVQGDKELGGDHFNESAELARRALEKFAPDSLRKFLNETPYGNHPDLIRTFSRIGKAMSNDTLVSANAQSAKTRSVEEILYDNTKE